MSQDRGPGAGGPHYQWTRKVKGKTVSLALSQANNTIWLKTAIENWRPLQATLRKCSASAAKNSSRPSPDPPPQTPLQESFRH